MAFEDQYEHVALIGRGYFSIVKEYREIATGTSVAVKTIKSEHLGNSDYVHRFRKEIEFLGELGEHPHIISLLDVNLEASAPYYVMPRADASLKDYISHHNNTLGIDERVALFDQVLDAIRYAHSKGIYHRDICPPNVLLFETDSLPQIQVSDFGLGKDTSEVSQHTRSSVAAYGHADYVAPEQEQKLKSADARSDVFSLGKLLNYMLTGRSPRTYQACVFGAIVKRATKVEPEQRYQSVDEMHAHLERLKPILLGTVEIEIRRVSDFQDFTSIDWDVFHKVAVEGDYEGHVYHGYLDPVMNIFDEAGNLQHYIHSVGDDVEAFVDVLIDYMDKCIGTVGWPFSASTSFTELLQDLFRISDSDDVKTKVMQQAWHIAFQSDQWGSQSIARDMLEDVPVTIEGEIAAYIAEGRCTKPLDYFNMQLIPRVIVNAISHATKA